MPNVTGVVLLDHDAAKDAIHTLGRQNPDEMAIICLGHQCPDAGSCCRRLNFPAFAVGADSPGHVLLTGCLHNLGGRPISVGVKDVDKIDLTASVTCTFQAFSDEWSQDPTWAELTQSPVRMLLEQLRQSGLALPQVQPWARSFKAKGKPVAAHLAETMQFNAVVPSELLPQLLRQSGHQGVYVTPRDEQGRLMQGWSIVWMTSDRAEAQRTALGVSEQAGLIRAKDRYGLRVKDADFDAVFCRLKPDQKPKAKVAVQYLYKLCPTPLGATETAILQWASGLSWPVRVLKALGPRQWLLGSPCEPPAGWLAFKGETVLTVPVHQKGREQQVVQAGHQNLHFRQALPKDSPTVPVDPLQKNDPWKAYNNRAQPVLSKASGSVSATPTANRHLPEDGPLAVRFQAQDDRLQTLEATVRDLKDGQRAQEQQRKADKAEMTQSLAGLSQQFAASLESMQRAQNAQQEQLVAGMNELKTLVLGQRNVSDQPKKRPASSDMDWSEDGKL